MDIDQQIHVTDSLKAIQKSSTSRNMFSAARNIFKLFTATSSITTPAPTITKIHLSNNLQRIPLTTPVASSMSAKRSIALETIKIECQANSDQSLGFTIAGYCPCHIAKLETNSVAAQAGLMIGDLIIKVNDKNVSRAKCLSIVKIIKSLHTNEPLVLEVLRSNTKVNLINSEKGNSEYAHLNQIKYNKYKNHQNSKKSASHRNTRLSELAAGSKPQHGAIHKQIINNKHSEQLVDNIAEEDNDHEVSYMPSPIPHMPPIKSEDAKCFRKYSVTDSDYKTQSYHTESDTSNNLDNLNNHNHMNACESILNLEEKFIDLMQRGVQQYSRPLRHCMLISPIEHHTLFQNIEKILAISEYQLHQLISHDDSALFDMFNTIGKLYENKLRMSSEAFDIYLNGVTKSFELLTNLSKKSDKKGYFNKFLAESSDDINMELKTFLLLPLFYVVSVFMSLKLIKSKTPTDSMDFQCLVKLLDNLEAHVGKAQKVLDEFSAQNPFEEEIDERLHLSNELVYSGNLKMKSGLRWQDVNVQLYKDRLCYSEEIDEEFRTEILLSNINAFGFNLNGRNEFQLSYSIENSGQVLCFRAESLHEKLKWKCLFEGN